MSAKRSDTTDTVRDDLATAARGFASALKTFTVLVVAASWSAFWARVVWHHHLQGELLDAAVTTALMVLPVVLGTLWYLSRRVDVDLPSVDLGTIPVGGNSSGGSVG